MVGYCRKYTVGHGDWRGGHPGYRPSSREDRAGVLRAPIDGVVVAVGRTVFRMWCSVSLAGQGLAYSGGVILRTPQVKVFRAPAVAGHATVLDPLVGVPSRTLGGPGDTWGFRTPRGRGPGLRLRVMDIPLRGTRGDAGPLPEQGWVRGHTYGEAESGQPE